MILGLRVLIYSGDADSVVNFMGTERWISRDGLKLNRKGKWTAWFGPDKQLAGYVQQYSGLTFKTVKGSGHMVRRLSIVVGRVLTIVARSLLLSHCTLSTCLNVLFMTISVISNTRPMPKKRPPVFQHCSLLIVRYLTSFQYALLSYSLPPSSCSQSEFGNAVKDTINLINKFHLRQLQLAFSYSS